MIRDILLLDEKLKTVFVENENKKFFETQAEDGFKWIEANPNADDEVIT